MKIERNLAYWFLLAAASLWLSLVLLPPYAASKGWSWTPLFYGIFSPVCHQIGDRSFQCFGFALGACHRCVGLYAGFIAGLLVMPSLPRLTVWLSQYPRRMAFFFLPMAADYFLWSNVWWSRGISGLVAAFPFGLFVWAALTQLLQSHPSTVRTNYELH